MSCFHCLLPVRDEADIIGECLEALLTWADYVTVFDTGSVDHTWEIVQDFAGRDKRVRPLVKDPVYFSETKLRGYLFSNARQMMHDGDWFLRVDADEFHHVPPPQFVKERLRKYESIIYHQYYDFHFTSGDLEKWREGAETVEDRNRPIAERRKYFIPSVYAEPRMCRYRSSMKWPDTVSFPFNAGVVARERLPIRHYPNRDPVQMKCRCLLRSIMLADSRNRLNWSRPDEMHWSQADWKKFVTPMDETGLVFWEQDADLPRLSQLNHMKAWPLHKRMLLRLAHGSRIIHLLDAHRPVWGKDNYPQKIPEEVQAKCLQLLSDTSVDLNIEGQGNEQT